MNFSLFCFGLFFSVKETPCWTADSYFKCRQFWFLKCCRLFPKKYFCADLSRHDSPWGCNFLEKKIRGFKIQKYSTFHETTNNFKISHKINKKRCWIPYTKFILSDIRVETWSGQVFLWWNIFYTTNILCLNYIAINGNVSLQISVNPNPCFLSEHWRKNW